MKKFLILATAALLFGCASTDNKNFEDKPKHEIKYNKKKATSSAKKAEIILASTSRTAIIRSIKAKHMFDQKTVVSTIEKAFDESGKVVYETPLITWDGPKPVISLPAGNYEILIGCWASGGRVYNYHRIKARIENEKDYTFFCLQAGKVPWGFNNLNNLYAFYSETPQLEDNQKKYQTEIDRRIKK